MGEAVHAWNTRGMERVSSSPSGLSVCIISNFEWIESLVDEN